MALQPRVFFTLHEASARWGCNIADIAGWADTGRFQILTGIAAVRCGEEIVAGKVVLSPMELLPLFRRCGTGPYGTTSRRRANSGEEIHVRKRDAYTTAGLDEPTRFVGARRILVPLTHSGFVVSTDTGSPVLGSWRGSNSTV